MSDDDLFAGVDGCTEEEQSAQSEVLVLPEQSTISGPIFPMSDEDFLAILESYPEMEQ